MSEPGIEPQHVSAGIGQTCRPIDPGPMSRAIGSVIRPVVFTMIPYVAGKTVEAVRREHGIEDVVKLSSNENPLGASPRVLAAITEALPHLMWYPEQSFIDLKEALAAANGVAPDNICVGHGSETIIQLIPQLCVRPGDDVVLAEVTYGRYSEVSKLMEANLVCVPLRDLRYDLEAMAAAVTERTRIVWIANPNNPTGTFVTRDEVKVFLEAVPRTVFVVIDQAYLEYADDPDYPDALEFLKAGYDNIIVLRTFSKAYGLAGIRLGYAISTAPVRQLIDTIKEPFNLNRVSVVAGPVALEDEEWTRRCVEENRAGRDLLTTELTALGLDPVPSQTNFVFFNAKQDADNLFERMQRRGVIIRPASAWGLPTYVRVTVGTPEQNRRFLEVLKEEIA
jgi:histidinol-phosphate aminotransferase